jgi:hypothetical protein
MKLRILQAGAIFVRAERGTNRSCIGGWNTERIPVDNLLKLKLLYCVCHLRE